MPAVVVDTSQWAQYFRVADSPEATEVRQLLASGDVVMVGIVYMELLRGARDQRQLDILEEELEALPFVDVGKATWKRAGLLLGELQRQGLTVPLPDAVIAAQALEHGLQVFTRDEHFQRIPGLQLYAPGS